MIHERHFSREEADALLPTLEPVLRELQVAAASLTDAEAHEVLSEASGGNGGGAEGKRVGEAFLQVRGILAALQGEGVVVRDISSGLVDFPAVRDGQEIYLCWRLGEESVAHWHDLDSGFQGRQALE